MRVNLFAFALLAVAGLQGATSAQDITWESSPKIEKVGYFQQDGPDEPDVAALQKTIDKLELRLREVEDDVQERLEAQPDPEEIADQTNSFEKRMADLEQSFQKNSERIQDLGDTTPSLLFHSHGSPKLQFYGRIHMDYWTFPNFQEGLAPLENGPGLATGDPQDRFIFRRLRIGVKGDLNDNMFYKYEGEFAGGNNPSYRDAFIGFKNLPILNTVILGNHKRPYGLDHLNSSRHNVFIERPFVVEAFNQDSRRLGLSSNGVSEDQAFNWRFGVWNQILTQNSSGYFGDDYQLEFAARLAHTYWYDESSGGRGWAHVGISGSVGDPGSDAFGNSGADYRTRPEARSQSRWLDTGIVSNAQTNYVFGLESAWNIGSLAWTSEYMRVDVDRDAGFADTTFEGAYGQLSYFLTGEHRSWNRKTGTLGRIKPLENFFLVKDCDGNTQRGMGAWEIAARYSYLDLQDQDIIGGEGKSFTLGLNWYWNAYARMQFNYINGEIERLPLAEGNYEIFGARFMVDF